MLAQQPSSAQHAGRFTPSLAADQQRALAGTLVTFLRQYRHFTDSYIIEFFSDDLWHTLPSRWQPVLQDLSYPQVADLLLDSAPEDRRYPSVWPLSLLAFRATAHALAFPRGWGRSQGLDASAIKPWDFRGNQSQSSLLGHIFRKHVKPKKQHEIQRLGLVVKQLCDQTECEQVVDVGSGQGHLTRFLSFGLGLSVTAIEADGTLVAMASKFDRELERMLEKERQKQKVSSPLPSSPHHVAGWVNPKASWKDFLKQLSSAESSPASAGPGSHDSAHSHSFHSPSGEAELHPDFVLTGLHACGDLSPTLLRHFVGCPQVRGITSVACCYMKLSTQEDPAPPGTLAPPLSQAPEPESPSGFGYPMSSWVGGLPGHQLSYKAREGACHAMEDYLQRLREGSAQLRSHCYRAMLEIFIREFRPELRRARVQTIKKSHLLTFNQYARLGLARVGLPPDTPLDPGRLAAMLAHQSRVVVYFSLALLLAPAVETLLLLDRILFLQENGVDSRLMALFNSNLSPRNFVLVALKQQNETERQ